MLHKREYISNNRNEFCISTPPLADKPLSFWINEDLPQKISLGFNTRFRLILNMFDENCQNCSAWCILPINYWLID